jgi:hypothetical protein
MKIALLLYTLLVSGIVYGQAKTGIIVYKKTHQPAASISIPYKPGFITAALHDHLSKNGSQSNDVKGFKVFKNTQFLQGDSRKADLYFKVIRDGTSDTGASIVYMMVGMPNENIVRRQKETHFTKDHAKSFLNNLVPIVEAYNLEVLINQQNEAFMHEELRYNDLVKNGEGLNKRKNLNEQKMLRNKHEQDLQNDEVERQKKALTYLISQRQP